MSDAVIHHLPDCRGVSIFAERGKYGDNLIRCRGCHRFAVVPPDAVTPERAPAATVTPERLDPRPVVILAAAAPLVGMVCREHLKPVSWKGTGCPECEAERVQAAGRVRRPRAERRTRAAVVSGVR